jgi:hypothetical protein
MECGKVQCDKTILINLGKCNSNNILLNIYIFKIIIDSTIYILNYSH